MENDGLINQCCSKARLEYDVLRNVQTLVEANYVNGRPRHHQESARNATLQEGASVFFIVEHSELEKMSAQEIQDVSRDRNILVRNAPQRRFEWNEETLSEFGDVTQPREIQGESNPHWRVWYAHRLLSVGEYRQDNDHPHMLKVSTLEDILDYADERVLVCLNLPMSASDIVPTPGLQ